MIETTKLSDAQRLAASRRASPSALASTTPSVTAAQRLAASRRASRPRIDDRRRHCALLNALRHHGGRHVMTAPEAAVRLGCSTPCGITEGVTRRPISRCSCRTASAQRLAASRRASRVLSGRDFGRFGRCSTPCGITEGVTYYRGLIGPDQRSAQRLAASRRASRDIIGKSAKGQIQCSTPCGITEGVTSHRARRAGGADPVLNALRHHGGRHRNSASG